MIVGTCAYPDCPYPDKAVRRGAVTSDETPVIYAKGFAQLRSGGGAHGFIGGVERIDGRIWHQKCAVTHREEYRNGRQEKLL